MAVMNRHPLWALIDDTREANGWSDEDVARRARERGHDLSKQTISGYRTNGLVTIVPKRIRALADGLGLPAERVAAAALATIGLARYQGDSWLAEDAVRADETLSEDTRAAVLAIIGSARAREAKRAEAPTSLDARRARRTSTFNPDLHEPIAADPDRTPTNADLRGDDTDGA